MPSFLTNAWQAMVRNFAAHPTAVVDAAGSRAGTWAGAGLITAADGAQASAALGAVLALYGVLGLTAVEFPVPGRLEPWLSPVIGMATGIDRGNRRLHDPVGSYLQAIGLEKDRLVQALGLSFTVSTLALAVALRATARSASRSPARHSPCSRRRCSAWRWVSGCAPGCAGDLPHRFPPPRCCSARISSCARWSDVDQSPPIRRAPRPWDRARRRCAAG